MTSRLQLRAKEDEHTQLLSTLTSLQGNHSELQREAAALVEKVSQLNAEIVRYKEIESNYLIQQRSREALEEEIRIVQEANQRWVAVCGGEDDSYAFLKRQFFCRGRPGSKLSSTAQFTPFAIPR